MQSFSKEFLRIQDEVRSEMMIGPNMCTEDVLSIKPRKMYRDAQEKEMKELVKEILGNDDQYVMDLNKKREIVSIIFNRLCIMYI